MRNFKRATGWMAVCCTLVGGFEGLACVAYPDKLAHGLPTVCYGETEGVRLGDRYTPEQCSDMLAAKLPRYYREIAACIPGVVLSDNEKAAYTSFAYNVGSGAFCSGSVSARLRKGDHKGACNALLAYDHASGRQIPGLHRRRVAEQKLCLTPDEVLHVTPPVIVAQPAPPPPPAPVVEHWWTRVWHWLKGLI